MTDNQDAEVGGMELEDDVFMVLLALHNKQYTSGAMFAYLKNTPDLQAYALPLKRVEAALSSLLTLVLVNVTEPRSSDPAEWVYNFTPEGLTVYRRDVERYRVMYELATQVFKKVANE
jgi:hypothetical protein